MKKFYKVIFSDSEWFCHAKYDGVVKYAKRPKSKVLVSTELEEVSELYFDTKKEATEFCEYIEYKNTKLRP